jgi:hypothetical protein
MSRLRRRGGRRLTATESVEAAASVNTARHTNKDSVCRAFIGLDYTRLKAQGSRLKARLKP